MSSIRVASLSDRTLIEDVYSVAFPKAEFETVTNVAIDILHMNNEAISLLAIEGEHVVGHISFSTLKLEVDVAMTAWILAPLAVMPDYQQLGIGASLIKAGLKKLHDRGVDWVTVYGDPAYYSRFGFNIDSALWLIPSYKLKFPNGWQALSLKNASAPIIRTKFSCAQSLERPGLW